MLSQSDDTPVRQQLLVLHAGLEAFAHGFGARQEEDDQVIGARLPGLGGAEPEVPIPALRKSGAPKAAQRIPRWPAVGIHEDIDIGADLLAESLDIQPERSERTYDSTRPCAGHSDSRIFPAFRG
jgi:hypothetical protein